MQYYYHPEIRLLLIPQSKEKEAILYDNNRRPWLMPKIGPRPPYYANPRYVPYYPVI